MDMLDILNRSRQTNVAPSHYAEPTKRLPSTRTSTMRSKPKGEETFNKFENQCR